MESSIGKYVKAIPTYYQGVKFRSRLEASYAMALDSAGLRWAYEPEGYFIGDTAYLPDFWLPRIKTFLEIKGPTVPGLVKAKLLYQHFNRNQEEGRWFDPEFLVLWGDELGDVRSIVDDDRAVLGTCGVCGGKWFFALGGSYRCRDCGFYEGSHHILSTQDKLELQQIDLNISKRLAS